MLLNGILIYYTSHNPASVSDIECFRRNQRFNCSALAKRTDEIQGVADFGPVQEENAGYGGVLMDKRVSRSCGILPCNYSEKSLSVV